MHISLDSAKSENNVLARGIPFDLATEFAWDSALIVQDLRKTYRGRRFQALGLIGDRLHMMAFTPRANKAHVISLRKANKREVKRYEAQV